MLPTYIEAEDSIGTAAWLERDGQRLPLKRVVEDLDPVASILPGAPTNGAAAAHARAMACSLEDVRVAAAILAGAAEKAELFVSASAYAMWTPTIASRAWAKPAVAAIQPLRQIVEGCAAFEDAIAGNGDGPRPGATAAVARTHGRRALTAPELEELERVGLTAA